MKRHVQREFRFDASESQTLCMDGSALRGNRETSLVPSGDHLPEGRSEKATSRTADMHAVEESDDLIVPAKRANNTGFPVSSSGTEWLSPEFQLPVVNGQFERNAGFLAGLFQVSNTVRDDGGLGWIELSNSRQLTG